MSRTVTSSMIVDVPEPTNVTLAVALAHDTGLTITEALTMSIDGVLVEPHEVVDAAGTRFHTLDVGAGTLRVDYKGWAEGVAQRPVVTELDAVVYQRPSRYCESDVLAQFAAAEFGGIRGAEAAEAVRAWVAGHLSYWPGSSVVTDGATHTLLARAGVCRDYCHVTIALLRALDLPSRMVGVYAPDLKPMDFHAVVEVAIDGEWHIIDPTGLAPVETVLRIATGRDAADTAFLTTTSGIVTLRDLTVDAQLS